VKNCEKTVQFVLFKLLSIAGHYFFSSFRQHTNSVERSRHFSRLSMNGSIFWCLHMKRISAWIGRVSSIRTNGNQTGQYQESMVGGIGFSISAFPSMFWRPVRHEIEHCHAGELLYRIFARIAAFFLQCSAQAHQLKSIPITYNGFFRLEQHVVHDTQLILSNTEHKLGVMDIRLCRRCWCMARFTPWHFSLWIVIVYPFFIISNDTMQKIFPFLPFK